MASPPDDPLATLFYHLVLPPKLPQECDDEDVSLQLQLDLGERLLGASETLQTSCPPRLHGPVWANLMESLRLARLLNHGHLVKCDLLDTFKHFSEDGGGEWLILHIARQNAALLIHQEDETIVFETFDAAAPTTAVLKAKHALTWDFPGRAVAISSEHFDNKSFQHNLANLLEQASAESYDRFAARAKKNGRYLVEMRDCSGSGLISEMLMSLLEGLGSAVSVRTVQKRVRDDVVLGSSEVPWRRSAYWLVLRIASRRILADAFGDSGIDRVCFKFIMCDMLADFLSDATGRLHPENTIMLQAKLSRRLAKLESEMAVASGELLQVYRDMFAATRGTFAATLKHSREDVSRAWDNYTGKHLRQIPRLPQRADATDLVLKLPNSGQFLLGLLEQKDDMPRPKAVHDISFLDQGTVSQVNQLSTRYAKIVDYEADMAAQIGSSAAVPARQCRDLALMLGKYLTMTEHAYTDDAIMTSRRMLRIFETWVLMDIAAVKACPLLAKYHPIFVPQSLDVLCLLTRAEMARLAVVQKYLASRIDSHNSFCGSILDDPNTHLSFPAQFVNTTKDGAPMRDLMSRIDDASRESRAKKISELKNLMQEYDRLSEDIEDYHCTCTRLPDGKKDVSGCKRCWKWRCRNRLKIGLHEDFLPAETPRQAVERAPIVFELMMPKYLAEYRLATFKLVILGTHLTSVPACNNPPFLLKEFDQLKQFWGRKDNDIDSLTLASIKKSFLQTHYKTRKLPSKNKEVLVPFAPEYSLYDNVQKVWVRDIPKIPWFQHLLGSNWLPKSVSDPYQTEKDRDMGDNVFRPSSYQIAANAPNSPPGVSSREYSAFQRIISARRRRWPELLVEFGATNLNHSSETAMEFLNHFALQAGPEDEESDVLREVHGWFRDEAFCLKLCEQLNNRLDALNSNWRAVQSMSIIVTFSLRLHHLCPTHLHAHVHKTLDKIRNITSGWIIRLRNEVRSTCEAEIAQTAANYAFRAALLCRQTFLCTKESTALLDHQSLRYFLRASIALQENILVNIDELAPLSRRLLIRDLHMSYSVSRSIQNWVQSDFAALGDLVNETWTGADSSNRRYFTSWRFLAHPHHWWVTSTTHATTKTASQTVHYHIIQGHLLVDGKPLGRLPPEIRKDPTIQELFGKQHLLTRASGLVGSQYEVMNNINRHRIHIGFINGRVRIRALLNGNLLEHVSRNVFKSPSRVAPPRVDLPATLVDDCIHWLNLDSGMLEMRKISRMWHQMNTNWTLDVRARLCSRNKANATLTSARKLGSSLVEPDSRVGKLIMGIFDGFEHLEQLTIYQPGKGSLSVEMKRLELQFNVNGSGRLVCQQLASEVDPNQDLGALHGLASHLVLRSRADQGRRSIIVPISDQISWNRKGFHPSIKINNDGLYVQFTIDHVLGRLDCAPEPAMLYLKAALHAFTSFPLPDKLTGRTGTEEAIHCLTSAESQPWSPLREIAKDILMRFRSLSPGRHQYPPGTNFYQTANWDKYLSMTIQNERLAPLADAILQQSQRLDIFWKGSKEAAAAEIPHCGMTHLNTRGLIRRQIYARIEDFFDSELLVQAAELVHYRPQDGTASSESRRVYRAIKALRDATEEPPKLSKLQPLLDKKDTVGGFNRSFENINVHEFLDTNTATIWGAIVRYCLSLETTPTAGYGLDFCIALAAYEEKADIKLISWLVALTKQDSLRKIAPPHHQLFTKYRHSEKPRKESLKLLILENQATHSNERSRSRRAKSSKLTEKEYQSNQRLEADKISYLLVAQWPKAPQSATELIDLVENLDIRHLDMEKAWDHLELEMQRLSRNKELSDYLDRLQNAVDQIPAQTPGTDLGANRAEPKEWTGLPPSLTSVEFRVPVLGGGLALVNLDIPSEEVLPPSTSANNSSPHAKANSASSSLPKEVNILKEILQNFATSTNSLRRQYGSDLEESISSLSLRRRMAPSQQPLPGTQEVYFKIQLAHETVKYAAVDIRSHLRSGDGSLEWLDLGGLLPCLSPVALLELLRKGQSVSPSMKMALVSYGVRLTELQRLLRMDHAAKHYDTRRLQQEHENLGHLNWSPLDEPEWLLLEIDNDVLIRKSQVDVARSIISPCSSTNSVLQMNMGEGKTSCVMPMAATVLADKTNMCRLVVPRALLTQTAQVIQRRIGRLIGRRVQHVPFTRRSPKGAQELGLYWEMHRDTLASGGVMLALPEHILSFRLSGLQQLVDKQMETADKMMEIQRRIDAHSRDVLDESDLMLSTKTQLIYPGGTPIMVDGHPHRWDVVEELLYLVKGHCATLEAKYGNKAHFIRRHSGFPIIQLLNTEVENALNDLLTDDVCEGRVSMVQLRNPSDAGARRDLKLIVSGSNVPCATWERVAESLVDKTVGTKSLYLLRGLISQRIVLLCLKKRWNVQFGLHPTRPPIAVPFEAKGVPSQTAEYGHPDTALVLTCLAFYQTGLTLSQMTEALQRVIKSDDPSTQYEHWTHGYDDLPTHLRNVNLLNADDDAQMEALLKHVRFCPHVLNYYMNNFVFPKHAKQFKVKLQASGWDIPLLSRNIIPTNGKRLTTGFSGTNDNKRMLPWTIEQQDLPSLMHTNAEVLCYLLETRNQTCHQAVDHAGRALTESALLALLNIKGIRILIDAGAHILEKGNHALAEEWLQIDHKAQGAVYFNAKGEAMVVARFQKKPVPLLASSFVDNMKDCVVYIDEAHTRGTDLKLPVNATGAVTLSMGQTKDQTVQAAMRLRQLGSTQSVAFIAPPEVYQDILDLHPKASGAASPEVTSVQVVQWLLEQSCKANEDMNSLHLAQGFGFCRRTDALWKYEEGDQKKKDVRKLLQVIVQREDQTLEELYGPRNAGSDTEHAELDSSLLQEFSNGLRRQQLEMHSKGTSSQPSAMAEVEQEREVEFEVQQIREKQSRVKLSPCEFPGLHPALVRFVQTGVLEPEGPFIQAFAFLGTTAIGREFGIRETGSRLFVSTEFSKAVDEDSPENGLKIIRPVEWVLWSATTETAVIVIPEEAELLMAIVHELGQPRVWILTYAASITKSMRPFNRPSFFPIPCEYECESLPTWLSIEVGLVAGRLYFDYGEYKPLLSWLGQGRPEATLGSSAETPGLRIKHPMQFLLEWLTYRRDGHNIMQTPMGFICQRRVLAASHSFFMPDAKQGQIHEEVNCDEN